MKIAYRLLVGILTLSVLGCGIFLALGGRYSCPPVRVDFFGYCYPL